MIIRQEWRSIAPCPFGAESRAVARDALLMDIPTRMSGLDDLVLHRDALQAGALPVGSVEFVRAAMELAGVNEPAPMSYPECLLPLLGRSVSQARLDELVELNQTGQSGLPDAPPRFIKPVRTKLFNGFIWEPQKPDSQYTAHDLEQLQALRSLRDQTPAEPVWISEVVTMASEWRFYVLGSRLVGQARYDDGHEDALEPEMSVVSHAIALMDQQTSPAPAAYALDFARLADGRTVLVEANDAWALGLYAHAMPSQRYMQMLAARWAQLRQDVRTD